MTTTTKDEIKLHCHKCLADWTPRKEGELPIQCPRCKSVSWNKPRKETKQ